MAKAVWLKQGSEKYYPAPYWPIGSIYISVVNTNPSQWFGGTWEAFAKGRTLVGVDTSQTEFNKVMKTGGANSSRYTPAGSNKGTALTVNQIPSHNHYTSQVYDAGGSGIDFPVGTVKSDRVSKAGNYWWNWTASTGGGQTHTHTFTGKAATLSRLQPFITCYIWIRTA